MDYKLIIILVFGVLGLVAILAEYISRNYGYAEIGRKILHISGGLSFAFMLMFLPSWYTGVIGLVFLGGMILARHRKWFSILDEKVARGYGELYFMIGGFMIFVVSIWHQQFALIMVYVLTLADGLAPCGQYIFPKKLYHKKTVGGSLVFFLITLGIIITFIGYSWQILCIALIITFAELFCRKGFDNLVIPLVTCMLLSIYQYL